MLMRVGAGAVRTESRVMRVYVGQLRAKLGLVETPLLVSDPGVGYRLVAAPSANR